MNDPQLPNLIYSKVTAVMNDITAIGKSRKNQAQGYSFRGIDDLYNELNQHMAKHGIFTVPYIRESHAEEKVSKSGSVMIHRTLHIEFTFYAEDGSFVVAKTIGEGLDSGDKAANKCMAVAHKYALLQVFCIPTEEPKDPENESHEIIKKPSSNENSIYEGLPDQKLALLKLCQINGILDPSIMGKISNSLKEGAFKMSEISNLIPKIYKDVSNAE